MSTLFSQARTRAPRLAEAAVEKARLSLVPARSARAPRAPFAVLVFAILGAGVVGLLMFNTHMQQGSFYATRLQQQAGDLIARQQSLDMQLERLRAPQRLATAGKALGMVAPGVPAFVKLADGTLVGTPTPASPDDAVRINPMPAGLPEPLRPKPIIVRVPAPDPAVDPALAAQLAAQQAVVPTARPASKPTGHHHRGATGRGAGR